MRCNSTDIWIDTNLSREGSAVFEQCLCEAASALAVNRRQTRRYPFLRPISITLDSRKGAPISAFTRDISSTGMGFLHRTPLHGERVTLTFAIAGQSVEIDADVVWSKPCGDGWYLSGGPFARLSAVRLVILSLSLVATEVNRRIVQRYPFFRQVMITPRGADAMPQLAYSRDISSTGIGLLHRRDLAGQKVTLTIPISSGLADLSVDLIWSKPCGDGWYASGGQLSELFMVELPQLLL